MRIVLTTYGSRGDVEPLVALAARLRALDADVLVCGPPDFAELLAGVGVPLAPMGWPVRPILSGATPPPAADLAKRAAELIAMQFEAIAEAAEGADVLVATGPMPVAAPSVAEKLGIRYVYASYCPIILPSPHHAPMPFQGRSLPPDVTDNRALWELDAQNHNALFGETLNTNRARIGLPPVPDVRRHILTDRPWLAADPTLAPWPTPADIEVVQTGAWIPPDERPLAADLTAFLDAGTPPVLVGFGSMPMRDPAEIARVAVEAARAHGRRVLVSHGWADLALSDDQDDCFGIGEVNQQALFRRVAAVVHHGGAGTTTTSIMAGAPQVVVPQMMDQPYWAGRVAELGIGAAHDGPTPTVESLSAALGTALTPETEARAKTVADTIRTDGATVAATLLLDAATAPA